MLEWVAIPFSRGSSQPMYWTQISHIASDFTIWATSEAEYIMYAVHIMENAGLDDSQAGINIAGRNSNNPRYAVE